MPAARPLLLALRRFLRVACAYGVLMVVALPAALGASMGPVMRELGAEAQEHLCKCGMPAGKCGCPECERLEHARQRARAADPAPAIKGGCDSDAPAVLFAALPTALLPAASTSLLPVPRTARLPVLALDLPRSLPDAQPPTPPPRSTTV